MKKAIILLGIATIFGLFCSGCATGPKYLYTEQKDSASIGVGQTQPPGYYPAYQGTTEVYITQIDGLGLGYGTSFTSLNGVISNLIFDPNNHQQMQAWVAPGEHTLSLRFYDDSRTVSTDVWNDQTLSTDTVVTATIVRATGVVFAEFAANHTYRLVASSSLSEVGSGFLSRFLHKESSTVEVTLWDETGGLAMRSRVGSWEFTGQIGH
jgi:hypothetical protein